jgi:hypothetical protein
MPRLFLIHTKEFQERKEELEKAWQKRRSHKSCFDSLRHKIAFLKAIRC